MIKKNSLIILEMLKLLELKNNILNLYKQIFLINKIRSMLNMLNNTISC